MDRLAEYDKLLHKADPDVNEGIATLFREEGIEVILNATIEEVSGTSGQSVAGTSSESGAKAIQLRPGDYVQQSVPCKSAPFAALMSWDQASFSDPHSAECRSRMLAQSGNRYDTGSACAALGDGTPRISRYVDTFTVIRLSKSRFELTRAGKPAGIYRWCDTSDLAAKSVKP